jgi:hypothetical protein
VDVQQVVNLPKIANKNLSEIEWRYRRLQKDVNTHEFKKQQSPIALLYFKYQIEIEIHSKAYYSYCICAEKEKCKMKIYIINR